MPPLSFELPVDVAINNKKSHIFLQIKLYLILP